MMRTGDFPDDFKRDSVAQITERGYPAKEVSARYEHSFALGLGSASSRRRCRMTPRRMLRSDDRSVSWSGSGRSVTS